MLFLFGFGYNTVNAQYVSKEVAVSRLQDASKELTKNWVTVHNSGDKVAIEKADLKLSYVSKMLTSLKEGASVKDTVNKYIASAGNMNVTDAQLQSNSKSSNATGWLKDELLEMLSL